MGFRTGTYTKVWTVESVSPTMTKGRISISRKNKNTGEYETDFSGYVAFVGQAAAQKALQIPEGGRIRLGDVDVTNTYDKEKRVTYWNPKIFSFEIEDQAFYDGAGHDGGVPEFLQVPDDDDSPF